ncbi:MAG: glycosyltransferase, partial [Verrucomicrobiota bacterium]
RLLKDERVAWLGPLKDVRSAYALFDTFLFPSHREGFGNVLLEAASMQVPVVAYRVTGCRDAVAEGISGLLVEPKDASALADAALDLLQDEALIAQLKANSRAWAVNHFERGAHQERLFEHYLNWAEAARKNLTPVE